MGKLISSQETSESSELERLAIDHFKSVLSDPMAGDTAKASAANGLASISRSKDKAVTGAIHRLSRSELVSEIERVKELLGH